MHEDGLYTKGYDVVPKNSKYEERIKNCPANSSTNGHWTEERGESVFISDDPRVKDILDKYGVKGVEYKNGIPDFSPFAVAEVKISGMTDKRVDNFKSADAKLAEQLSTDGKVYTAKDIEKWRKENNYTWHELNDVETIQLVPTNINAPIFKHLGGCSEYKKGGK
ncbi:MAG TPA: NAD+--asparagine ADP-ribosyltransferase-like protein [Lachnospiraceae bacterium]|nr:NAD+--asparagine ADP-ribosyltransferase-like protein [Lachnospiraceae bacterium]